MNFMNERYKSFNFRLIDDVRVAFFIPRTRSNAQLIFGFPAQKERHIVVELFRTRFCILSNDDSPEGIFFAGQSVTVTGVMPAITQNVTILKGKLVVFKTILIFLNQRLF